ncbi:MAG: cobalamin-binding protein [Candidatus Bathyarchaeota archaeon]|nr:cobalamin-binding protein [Candidatus Bathyarchaeota archaeon]
MKDMLEALKTVGHLKFQPKRIVSLSPSNTEILFAAGAGEKVVGVTDYCNYPLIIKDKRKEEKITAVGGYWDPSIDAVASLKPDLVLVTTVKCTKKENNCREKCTRRCELTTEVAKQLGNMGLTVLTLSPHSLNDVLDDVLSVGRICGTDSEAVALVKSLRERIARVVTESKKLRHKPLVYFENWNDPYMSVSSGTWIGNLVDLAGGTNIFGDAASEWPIITPETIIQRNPDIVVFPVIPGTPRFWGSFEEVKKRRGWETITAVKNSCLFEVDRDLISRPGPRLVDALEFLACVIKSSTVS